MLVRHHYGVVLYAGAAAMIASMVPEIEFQIVWRGLLIVVIYFRFRRIGFEGDSLIMVI